jgi:hypothetical protein
MEENVRPMKRNGYAYTLWRVRGDGHVDAYAFEQRSAWWIFAFAYMASSLYGWLAGTSPFKEFLGAFAPSLPALATLTHAKVQSRPTGNWLRA